MKNNKNPSQNTTTVCVDAVTRDRVNDEAERLGLSQRQMIERLLESYETKLKLESEEHDIQAEEDLLKGIYDSLDKVIKRGKKIPGRDILSSAQHRAVLNAWEKFSGETPAYKVRAARAVALEAAHSRDIATEASQHVSKLKIGRR